VKKDPNGRPEPVRRPSDPVPDPARFVRLGLAFYGGLLAFAGVGAVLAGRSLLYASAGEAAAGIDWPRDLAIGACAGVLVIALSALLTATTRLGDRLADGLARLLGPLALRDCIVLALASGVAEEAFFRGLLQPWLGWVAASVLFGCAHVAPRRDLLPWTGFALAAGFGLGALFEATGNLVAPVVAHALINAVNLRLLALRWRGGPPGSDA
jgi:membrane protease YdiL (CAAX protease family)